MNEAKLKTICLKDWKGRNIEIAFNQDRETTITGRNGIGKTSVMKAFLWLLTGRTDSNGKVNSELFDNTLELTPDTPPAIVEAVVEINGIDHTLARSAKAKFKRPKGAVEPVKDSSDDYKFFIDGMPFTSTDYEGWISTQLANTNLLPVCILGEAFSNFTENDRAKARKLLTDLIGEQKLEKEDYPEIKEELETMSADEITLLCKTNIKSLSDELNEIPTKIRVHRENLQMLKESVANAEDKEKEIEDLERQIEEQQQKANNKLDSVNNHNKEYRRLNDRKQELEKSERDNDTKQTKIANEIHETEKTIETLEKLGQLKERICPTCGSPLMMSDEELEENKVKIDSLKSNLAMLNTENKRLDEQSYEIKKELDSIVLPEIKNVDIKEEQDEINRLNGILKEARSSKAITDQQRNQIAAEESAIESLEMSRKEQGVKLAEWERKKIDIDRYVQDAADKLSKTVNSHLKNTKIQMFDTQKNGEKKPSCIITNADGVKYSTLNFSARMLCNVEISRMFCRLLGVNLPCFVDECSVFDSKHLPVVEGTQMIYMRCSDDQKLTVL